jgi:hypothetical protein
MFIAFRAFQGSAGEVQSTLLLSRFRRAVQCFSSLEISCRNSMPAAMLTALSLVVM